MKIEGNTAWVTGGASGLGEASVRRLTQAGAKVAILDFNIERAEQVASEVNGIAVHVDVSDEPSVAKAVAQAAEQLGAAPRIAVNCAGIGMAARVVGREGREELALALSRHATSKIERFEDLGGLLEQVGAERRMGLLGVPRTLPAERIDEGLESNREIASAKVYATEMLARVTDEAIQIFGGMGLMDELPLERFWRDARVERIWDGTSEIQRHIISRDLLRPLGG